MKQLGHRQQLKQAKTVKEANAIMGEVWMLSDKAQRRCKKVFHDRFGQGQKQNLK